MKTEKKLTWNYLPRRSNFESKFQRAAFKDASGLTVFTVCASFNEDVRAKADMVLVALNSHAELLDSLKRTLVAAECLCVTYKSSGTDEMDKICTQARSCLAQATGGKGG